MRVETEGYEAGVSWYLYGLVSLATLTLISPLIGISVPLLVLFGPIAVSWRRRRDQAPRLGRGGRIYPIVSSTIVVSVPIVTVIWYLLNVESDAPEESFWLLLIGAQVSPFVLSTFAYNWRVRRANVPGR